MSRFPGILHGIAGVDSKVSSFLVFVLLVMVVVRVVPEYPLVVENSGSPYSVVVVVAPLASICLEAFAGKWNLFVVLLVLPRSNILSILHSVLLWKMALRL